MQTTYVVIKNNLIFNVKPHLNSFKLNNCILNIIEAPKNSNLNNT